jgi:hypothetical protein
MSHKEACVGGRTVLRLGHTVPIPGSSRMDSPGGLSGERRCNPLTLFALEKRNQSSPDIISPTV